MSSQRFYLFRIYVSYGQGRFRLESPAFREHASVFPDGCHAGAYAVLSGFPEAGRIDLFNYQNEKSNFKMNDASHVPTVLTELFLVTPYRDAAMYESAGEPIPESIAKLIDMNITATDIEKFCILIFRSCRSFDAMAVDSAAYMYYLVRNIIALRHTKEAKTDFAAELINNICNTITFIRDKESEFNESNMDKSKSAKKHRAGRRA